MMVLSSKFNIEQFYFTDGMSFQPSNLRTKIPEALIQHGIAEKTKNKVWMIRYSQLYSILTLEISTLSSMLRTKD